MSRLFAMTEFQHPTRGLVLRNEIWDEDDPEIEAKLRLDDTALFARNGMEVRHMTRVKALETVEEPSTGNTILKGQILAVSEGDASALIATGKARAALDDEEITRDVGLLRDEELPAPKGEK